MTSEPSGLISIALLEEIVAKLLTQDNRHSLILGFIELIKYWHKPKSVQRFADGMRGIVASRGGSLADVQINDLIIVVCPQLSFVGLSGGLIYHRPFEKSMDQRRTN